MARQRIFLFLSPSPFHTHTHTAHPSTHKHTYTSTHSPSLCFCQVYEHALFTWVIVCKVEDNCIEEQLRFFKHCFVIRSTDGGLNSIKDVGYLSTVPPMLRIENQLVGAYEGQTLTLECHSEAYPRPITYWTTPLNETINNGNLYSFI